MTIMNVAFCRRLAILVVAALPGCAVLSAPVCSQSQQSAIHDILYFGTAKPVGIVSVEEWATFVDTVITPRFPMGLTLSQASGQWQLADGTIVREPSNVLEIVHAGDAIDEAAVREIIDTYRAQFQQEAVLRVRSPSCISFY